MPTIQKWGNSLAIRIPSSLADQMGVKAGTSVQIRTEDGSLLVTPDQRPKFRLKELLKNCNPDQLHGEADWGEDVGREVIE